MAAWANRPEVFCIIGRINYDVSMLTQSMRILPIILMVSAGCGSPAPVGSPSPPPIDSLPPSAAADDDAPPAPDEHAADPPRTGAPVAVASVPLNEETSLAVETFRPPDLRPHHDPAAIAQYGIRLYESRRLKLYTDIDHEAAEPLPPLMDALFDEWQDYFGELPPARDDSEFQLTGYLMRDQQAFREAGLLPVNLAVFAHGKHDGQQFWMNDQEHAYYRRHLLFHEATHCYMQTMGGTTVDVPLWYLEGMAELFATHHLEEGGSPAFRVVPHVAENFIGFGRMEMIDHDIREGHAFTLLQLTSLTAEQFQQRQSSYAWSWMTCLLADRNPNYHVAFRELGRRYPREGFANVRRDVFDPLTDDFAVEWSLIAKQFEYGHDFAAMAIHFQTGAPIEIDGEQLTTVEASRGWQSSGILIDPDAEYDIESDGQVTLADEPRPWISESQGITIRYAGGQPIGRLLGMVIGDAGDASGTRRSVGDIFPIGRRLSFTPGEAGTLYLRINDFCSEVADNTGRYDVLIRRQTGGDSATSRAGVSCP